MLVLGGQDRETAQKEREAEWGGGGQRDDDKEEIRMKRRQGGEKEKEGLM